MQKVAQNMILLLIFAALAFIPSTASAYSMVFDLEPNNNNGSSQLTLSSSGFSFSDSYNKYSESTWEVASAVDDGNGGVNVTYNYSMGDWDSYSANVGFSFQILSDSGDLTPETVTLAGRGGLSLDHQVHIDPYSTYSTACCFGSDIALEGPVWWDGEGMSQYNGNQYLKSGSFDDSFELLTTTTYYFYYSASLYVESWIRDPLMHFNSWEEYNQFIEETGGIGESHASSNGGAEYILSITSVPEPAITLIIGFGILGIVVKRKFR